MIKNAKVSLSTIKQFEQSVAVVRDYSSRFDKGILCLGEFENHISDNLSVLKKTIESIQSAQSRLVAKIRDIEAEIARLTARLNELKEQLSSLEDELRNTSESFTMINDQGENQEVKNPAYVAIEIQIANVKAEIKMVETNLLSVQQKLEHTNSVNNQLTSHVNDINGAIYSLEEKRKSCMRLKTELEEIKISNLRKSKNATDNLKKIEEVIAEYLRIKMKYDDSGTFSSNIPSSSGNVNIGICISKTVVQEQRETVDGGSKGDSFSEEDIEKHHIIFDNSGKICQYDDKTFGGKYNSYERRLDRTLSDENPIWGRYEGERGESKFIPYGRTVEGVAVKDILREYGLDGIEYRNAEPDFEVCAEAVVKIKAMSENRENYNDLNGIPMLGNFSQADIACARLWNTQKRGGRCDWIGRNVLEYRKANKLSWHEKCDTETMVLVRTEINDYFKHSGGCSECRMRDADQSGGGFDE